MNHPIVKNDSTTTSFPPIYIFSSISFPPQALVNRNPQKLENNLQQLYTRYRLVHTMLDEDKFLPNFVLMVRDDSFFYNDVASLLSDVLADADPSEKTVWHRDCHAFGGVSDKVFVISRAALRDFADLVWMFGRVDFPHVGFSCYNPEDCNHRYLQARGVRLRPLNNTRLPFCDASKDLGTTGSRDHKISFPFPYCHGCLPPLEQRAEKQVLLAGPEPKYCAAAAPAFTAPGRVVLDRLACVGSRGEPSPENEEACHERGCCWRGDSSPENEEEAGPRCFHSRDPPQEDKHGSASSRRQAFEEVASHWREPEDMTSDHCRFLGGSWDPYSPFGVSRVSGAPICFRPRGGSAKNTSADRGAPSSTSDIHTDISKYYDSLLSDDTAPASGWRRTTDLNSLAVHRPLGVAKSTTEHYRLIQGAILQHSRGSSKQKLVLDAGCGLGAAMVFLSEKEPEWEILGVTLSEAQRSFFEEEVVPTFYHPAGVETSTRTTVTDLLDLRGKKIPQMHVGNFDDLAWVRDRLRNGRGMDALYAIESIVHSPDLGKTLQAWASVLQRDGVLVVLDDFLADADALFSSGDPGLDRDVVGFRTHWLYPGLTSVRILEQVARKSGLRLEETRNIGEEFDVNGINYGGKMPAPPGRTPVDVLDGLAGANVGGVSARQARENAGAVFRQRLTVSGKMSYKMLVFRKVTTEGEDMVSPAAHVVPAEAAASVAAPGNCPVA